MKINLPTIIIVPTMKNLFRLFNCSLWLLGVMMVVLSITLPMVPDNFVDLSWEYNRRILTTITTLGAIITLIATLACCCTIREHPALLYLYVAFSTVIALLPLGIAVSYYANRDSIFDKYDQYLNDTMLTYGEPENKKKTAILDRTQSGFQCCGRRNYTDWSYILKKIPQSCCKVPLDTCDVDNVNDIYTQGCYGFSITFAYMYLWLPIALAITIYPLTPTMVACSLASNINKVKYEQVA